MPETKDRRSQRLARKLPPLLLLCVAGLDTAQAGERPLLPPPLTPYREAAQSAPEARPREALSVHEPMYFLLGDGRQFTARFQLSFKYRLFDQSSPLAQALPPLQGFHLGYTQTSLWNLGKESRPFEDTSYRPSFFWLYDSGGLNPLPGMLRLGYEHESNGRSEPASRSIDTVFVQPGWRTVVHGRKLSLAPKLYAYLENEDNPDIREYRGYADWIIRYGNDNSWVWHGLYRHGIGGRSTLQLDISYPMRKPLFIRTGAFLHFQLLHGYGDTLLNYNAHTGLRFWLGVSVTR